MKKKVISVLLCATMVMGLAAGCGSSTASDSKKSSDSGKTKVRMTYWNSEDTMESLLDYLKKEVPDIEVEYQFVDNSNYDTIVDTQLSAGEGPDIICESPASSLKHAKLGYLENLDDLATGYSDAGCLC